MRHNILKRLRHFLRKGSWCSLSFCGVTRRVKVQKSERHPEIVDSEREEIVVARNSTNEVLYAKTNEFKSEEAHFFNSSKYGKCNQ